METCESGLRMDTCALPATAMSDAGMLAVSRVGLWTVVERGAPFQSSVAPATKLSPSPLSTKAGPPAVALLGVSSPSRGAGKVPPVQLTRPLSVTFPAPERVPPESVTAPVPSVPKAPGPTLVERSFEPR